MADHPIIMSAESVRAIRAKVKVQTRRVLSRQPPKRTTFLSYCPETNAWMANTGDPNVLAGPRRAELLPWSIRCPYGQPGDRLRVKEVWGVWSRAAGGRKSDYPGHWLGLQYRATPDEPDRYVQVSRRDWLHYREKSRWQRWRSPRFMPRWASRLWPPVVEVRAVQIQDISPEDAIVEGIQYALPIITIDDGLIWFDGREIPQWAKHCNNGSHVEDAYMDWWDLLNAKRGHPWSNNDWVWAITFRLEPNIA